MNAALGDVDKFGEFSCGNLHVDAPLAVLFRERLRLKSHYFGPGIEVKIPKKKHEGAYAALRPGRQHPLFLYVTACLLFVSTCGYTIMLRDKTAYEGRFSRTTLIDDPEP
jgi:hypothetical protein